MDRGQADYLGPMVVPEVRPFKQRELTFGLPHLYAVGVIWAACQIWLYFHHGITALLFALFAWALGRAGNHFDPYWFENLWKIPAIPRYLPPR
jgi:hypothetical protein